MKDRELALKLMFDKSVNCFWLIITFNVDDYNRYVRDNYTKIFVDDFLLTKEEYDLLTAVFNGTK